MKQYEPYRGPGCPTGRHAADDPKDAAGDPLGPDQAANLRAFNEVCDCPWLTVTSTTPVPHMTSWTRRELERLIGEADKGYFDPGHFPPRNGRSQFMPPLQQRLLLLLEQGRTLAAVQVLLGELIFDGVSWDPSTGCLSLRHQRWGAHGVEHEWLQLWLEGGADGDTLQYTATGETPGGQPETIDGIWEERSKAQAAVDEVQQRFIDSARGHVRELVRGVIKVGDVEIPVDVSSVSSQDGMTVAHGTLPSGAPVMIAQPSDVMEGQITIDAALVVGYALDEVAQVLTNDMIEAGLLPEGHELYFDKTPLIPSPADQEPVAIGQVFRHRLRDRWVEITYVSDDRSTAVGRPVDAGGAGIRGRRATITLESDGCGLKMYDRDRGAESSREAVAGL